MKSDEGSSWTGNSKRERERERMGKTERRTMHAFRMEVCVIKAREPLSFGSMTSNFLPRICIETIFAVTEHQIVENEGQREPSNRHLLTFLRMLRSSFKDCSLWNTTTVKNVVNDAVKKRPDSQSETRLEAMSIEKAGKSIIYVQT